MKILAIDTSCDETAAAVTEGTKILSNVIWSQASAHAKFGGVFPSLAQRKHQERIGFVVKKAVTTSGFEIKDMDALAVTVGNGLAIALGVGIDYAKEVAKKYHKPLIPMNHSEAHVLSPLAQPKTANDKSQVTNIQFPSLGLVLSGGNTVLVKINSIGNYERLAATVDDALGEALDKAARMLGLGYPGGPVLEKFAKLGDPKKYKLPIPIVGQEHRQIFTYSGLKTAMMRLVDKEKPLTRQKVYDLAASFQYTSFQHIIRVLRFVLTKPESTFTNQLLLGGGVIANIEIKKQLRKLCKDFGIKLLTPYSKKLCGDNAAMIGTAAYLKIKHQHLNLEDFMNYSSIDRNPNLKV